MWKVQTMMVVKILLSHGLLDFTVDLIDDGHQIVFKFDLQLLMMAATLIRRPLSEYLRESEENFSPTAGRLRRKFYTIINHELQIDLIFLIAPLTYLAFTFIEMISSHPARQMCLRLETLLPLFQRATVLPTQWNVTLLIRSWSWSC